jgi:hypothetical protein
VSEESIHGEDSFARIVDKEGRITGNRIDSGVERELEKGET